MKTGSFSRRHASKMELLSKKHIKSECYTREGKKSQGTFGERHPPPVNMIGRGVGPRLVQIVFSKWRGFAVDLHLAY